MLPSMEPQISGGPDAEWNTGLMRGVSGDYDCGRRIVGASATLKSALEYAKRAAESDADILIEAESGTGKELLARFIHASSRRSAGPFVAINCAAVPESLLESELFGHVRGAFTGAITSKLGKIAHAEGGTLLLDEVGEMPLLLQPKLLRFLQEREIERVGDTQARKVNVRIVATTNRCLQSMVREGSFRADLFYRLNVIPLRLPPLRERRRDIVDLAHYFAAQYSPGRCKGPELSPEFLAGLEEYGWPGNVRELENFMHRVVALFGDGVVGPECLKPLRDYEPRKESGLNQMGVGFSLREAEKHLLEMTLDATQGNRTRAAEMLGISIRTIRNKIREYGLPRRNYA